MPRLLQLDPPGFAAALKRLLTVPGPSGRPPSLNEMGSCLLAVTHPSDPYLGPWLFPKMALPGRGAGYLFTALRGREDCGCMVGTEAGALRGCSSIVACLHGQAGASGACQLPSSAHIVQSVHARCLQGPAVLSASGAEPRLQTVLSVKSSGQPDSSTVGRPLDFAAADCMSSAVTEPGAATSRQPYV